jgi:hypothetical protein
MVKLLECEADHPINMNIMNTQYFTSMPHIHGMVFRHEFTSCGSKKSGEINFK